MAVFEINKSNLIFNIRKIKSQLNDNVKVCAMLKADAYGHNINIISNLLKDEVEYFGVATISEGVKLREQGIKNRILCVGICKFNELSMAIKNNIEVTIDSLERLIQIKTLITNQLKIHLKIDTGMHRLGFQSLSEFKNALSIIKSCKSFKLIGIFTHFADSRKQRIMLQSKLFDEFIKLCPSGIIKHASNSNASKYSLFQYDMVRVGISLYGYGNETHKKVLKIKSNVVSIRNVKKGEFVGYDCAYTCKSDCKIATVFLGYYDGINRKLSCKINVKINGKKYKVVGKICMDMFMVLVDDNVKVGDEVIVFEDANIWANIIQTIPYEVLTSFKYNRMEIQVVE